MSNKKRHGSLCYAQNASKIDCTVMKGKSMREALKLK